MKLNIIGRWEWSDYSLNGCGIYGLNGWGIYDLNEWGIYDLMGGKVMAQMVGAVMAKWVTVLGMYAQKIKVSTLSNHHRFRSL